MFAYCGNNPVNRSDPSGQFWFAVIAAVAVVASTAAVIKISNDNAPKSDVGAARQYVYKKASDFPLTPNCYAYALHERYRMDPGDKSGRKPSDVGDVYDVGASVQADVMAMGYTIREISGPNAKVYENEYKIALRVSTVPYMLNIFTGELECDYHFMVQTATGQWAEKAGWSESVIWDIGMNPDTIDWGYYDSDIIYYAIGM